MKEIFLNWLIPFLCGGVISTVYARIGMNKKKIEAMAEGLQCLLRAEIIRSHDKYTEKAKCPIYAKEALKRAYKSYHTLDGNDVATDLYNETMHLPTE